MGSRTVTWRRFANLMRHLPPESAFATAFALRIQPEPEAERKLNDGIAAWSLTDQLLAHIVDILALANYQRGGGKGSKPKLLTAGTRRSAKPAQGVDVRSLLQRLAPASDEQDGQTDGQ